jgi:hypothetical protein
MADRERCCERVRRAVETASGILFTDARDLLSGRQLSVPFLTKPSKHDYPDYYLLIHSPIALDDIKRHLNKGKYSSLEDYKSDFELLFANAKQYNRPDSTIYEDAEYLLVRFLYPYLTFYEPSSRC